MARAVAVAPMSPPLFKFGDTTHCIASFLGVKALGRLCAVSHAAHDAVRRDQPLWKERFRAHYREAEAPAEVGSTVAAGVLLDRKEAGKISYYDEYRRAVVHERKTRCDSGLFPMLRAWREDDINAVRPLY